MATRDARDLPVASGKNWPGPDVRERQRAGIPMEALPQDSPPPPFLASFNPARLPANIAAFERLLEHNRQAIIVWAHAGWDDPTGERTVPLMRALLAKHANLSMSIKLGGAHLAVRSRWTWLAQPPERNCGSLRNRQRPVLRRGVCPSVSGAAFRERAADRGGHHGGA
jgi:hypothetical protein